MLTNNSKNIVICQVLLEIQWGHRWSGWAESTLKKKNSATWEKKHNWGEHFHSCQHGFRCSSVLKTVFTFGKNWNLELSADQDCTSTTSKFKVENIYLARADTVIQQFQSHFNKLQSKPIVWRSAQSNLRTWKWTIHQVFYVPGANYHPIKKF